MRQRAGQRTMRREAEQYRIQIDEDEDALRLAELGHRVEMAEGRRFVAVMADDERHARIKLAGHLITGLAAASQWRAELNRIADRLTTF